MTPQDIIDRGIQAKRVLDDTTVQKVFEAVRNQFINALEVSELGDRDTHHEIALSLQALRSIQRQLNKWVMDGEVEIRRKELT